MESDISVIDVTVTNIANFSKLIERLENGSKAEMILAKQYKEKKEELIKELWELLASFDKDITEKFKEMV